jgi:hypothetical protein
MPLCGGGEPRAPSAPLVPRRSPTTGTHQCLDPRVCQGINLQLSGALSECLPLSPWGPHGGRVHQMRANRLDATVQSMQRCSGGSAAPPGRRRRPLIGVGGAFVCMTQSAKGPWITATRQKQHTGRCLPPLESSHVVIIACGGVRHSGLRPVDEISEGIGDPWRRL